MALIFCRGEIGNISRKAEIRMNSEDRPTVLSQFVNAIIFGLLLCFAVYVSFCDCGTVVPDPAIYDFHSAHQEPINE